VVVLDGAIMIGINGHRLKFNPINAELNPICHLPALLEDATIVVISRIRFKEMRFLKSIPPN
jgi:hypothetical protein